MKKKHLILPFIICLALFSFNVFSQDYTQDSLAVKAILDSNGLSSTPVSYVTDSSGGRIVNLNLSYKWITTIPPEIGNLTALRTASFANDSLTTLPAEIGNLTALTVLYLYANKFCFSLV